MPETSAPPEWILILLWPFKGESCYQQIEGDLCEEFKQREAHGMAAARRWYYREVCRNFWAMIWRGITIPLVIAPFLCVLLGDVLRHALLKAFLFHLRLPVTICIDSLVNSALIGLLLGMICARMLRGHERLARLAFGAYQLLYLIMTVVTAQVFGPSPLKRAFLLGLIYLSPICTFIFFWVGSSWIERRHHPRYRAG